MRSTVMRRIRRNRSWKNATDRIQLRIRSVSASTPIPDAIEDYPHRRHHHHHHISMVAAHRWASSVAAYSSASSIDPPSSALAPRRDDVNVNVNVDVNVNVNVNVNHDEEERRRRRRRLHTAQVHENGKRLTVTMSVTATVDDTTEPASFAAPWLWVQDPQWIHPTSGQRLRTLGQYRSDQRIRHAQIVDVEEATTTTTTADHSLCSPPPPPPPPPPLGSYHPRGGVYDTDKETIPPATTHPQPQEQRRLLVQVTWSDGEVAHYDWDWLQRMSSASASATTRIRQEIVIGAETTMTAAPIPTLDYHQVMSTEEGRFQTLHGIIEHGAVLIREAPIHYTTTPAKNGGGATMERLASDATVADLGKRLSGGRLSHGSLYGDTFRVVSQPDAQNIAYTTVALPPHQDLTYYESKPFLQLLHCISTPSASTPSTNTNTNTNTKREEEDGASVLIDAMAAAEYLRTVAPELFATLTRVECTFVKQRPGADMVSFKPHIVTSSTTEEVIQVHWSPPFEGPLLLPSPSPSPPNDTHGKEDTVEDYVRAYQALEILLDNRLPSVILLPFVNNHHPTGQLLLSEELQADLRAYSQAYTWEYTLQPGDLLVFNNQRMCHGRRAFSLDDEYDEGQQQQQQQRPPPPPQERHLIGCYTDAMETSNEYRLLLRQRGLGESMRSVGNGTRGSPQV